MTLIEDRAFLRPAPVQSVESAMMPIIARPVLARDADATYWMSRYMERAEHIARLLLVNNEALLDVGDLASTLLKRHWLSVLQIMNVEQLPSITADNGDDDPFSFRIAEYMTFDESNPNSLIRCLTRSRENARGIREVISSEMWEHLNLLYWSIRSDDAKNTFRESPDQFYQQIINGSALFQGLTDQTLVHGQRWFFTQLGKYFERITVVCRTLKTKYEILFGSTSGAEAVLAETPIWNIHWLAVLRSCGSVEAYRRVHLGEIDLGRVAQFLVLQNDFPKSIRYCVRGALEAISAIRVAVRPRAIDPTERILGRLDAQLEYADPSELSAETLPAYLDRILENIVEAALAVQRSFFMH